MKIVLTTDFSDCAAQAEGEALRLARGLHAELVLVHVAVEVPLYSEGLMSARATEQVYDAQRKWAEQELEARAGALRAQGAAVRWVLRIGVPFEEIVRTAREEAADIIVIGTHGRDGLNRLLLGSVAERVIRTAPCPVLTVRQPEAAGKR